MINPISNWFIFGLATYLCLIVIFGLEQKPKWRTDKKKIIAAILMFPLIVAAGPISSACLAFYITYEFFNEK